MTPATKLLSVPGAFSDGDFGLWLRKFELCLTANGWEEDEMLKRLPKLLSGKAFVVFERLGEDKKESFKTLVESIKEAFGGDATSSNEQEFRRRVRKPAEDIQVFAYALETCKNMTLTLNIAPAARTVMQTHFRGLLYQPLPPPPPPPKYTR